MNPDSDKSNFLHFLRQAFCARLFWRYSKNQKSISDKYKSNCSRFKIGCWYEVVHIDAELMIYSDGQIGACELKINEFLFGYYYDECHSQTVIKTKKNNYLVFNFNHLKWFGKLFSSQFYVIFFSYLQNGTINQIYWVWKSCFILILKMNQFVWITSQN